MTSCRIHAEHNHRSTAQPQTATAETDRWLCLIDQSIDRIVVLAVEQTGATELPGEVSDNVTWDSVDVAQRNTGQLPLQHRQLPEIWSAIAVTGVALPS